MWVEDLPNGKYKYVERYFDEKTGKQRTKSVTLTSDSPQARNKAIKILNKKINTKEKQTTQLTFKEAYDEYVKYMTPRWEHATYKSFVSSYDANIKDRPINDYLINKITLKDVQEVIDYVQYEKGLSRRSAIGVKTVFLSVFRHLNKNDISETPDLKLIDIKKPEPKTDVTYIDSDILQDEIDKMYDKLQLVQAQTLEMQILTGTRIGETIALTKDDWDGKQIIINKSVDTANKRKIKRTKNNESTRIIDSNERINQIFEERIKLNDILFQDKSHFIFVNTANRPLIVEELNRDLKKINKKYTTHVMRRTHISLLSENNFPLKYIMERVGHTDPDTTLKIYTAVTNKQKEKAQEKLNNLF